MGGITGAMVDPDLEPHLSLKQHNTGWEFKRGS